MPDEENRTKVTRKRKGSQDSTLSSYQDLAVGRIRGNSWNPRSSGFDGQKFDELVASIRQKGVIQPIVVRSIQEQDYDFEIIAGERRHRAMSLIASQDPARSTIPAIIRECGDEEAFEICFIENLQRQDLSEPEEARAFADYVDRKGPESITMLAEKLGVSSRYVRKRVEIMRLPKPLIWAWQKEILQYGHLEQFLRIGDKKERLVMLKQILSAWTDGEGIPTVRDFKHSLDEASADLAKALFDKKACIACARNSETQRNLFGIEDDHAHCLDSRCYLAKQKEWLSANWKSYLKELDPELDTNGIRFSDEVSYPECEPFYYKNIAEKCHECESFVTLLNPGGSIRNHRACSGRKECRREVLNARSSSSSSIQPGASAQNPLPGRDETESQNDTPLKSWHGEYFREEFFKTRIPEKAKELDPFDDKMVRLSLFALVSSNSHIHPWFAERLDLAKKPKETDYGFFLHCKDILPAVESIQCDRLRTLLQEATIEILLSNRTVMADTRRRAARFLGIDLATEWRITKDYLEKKTKSEIVSIINRFNILDRPEAWKFATESCCLKLKSAVGKLKKEKMIAIILESGIDLSGIVPAEILHDSTPLPAGASQGESNGEIGNRMEANQSDARSATGRPTIPTGASPFPPYGSREADPGYTLDPEEEDACAQ
jgi:ParB/RepB/Spo0J family partition protein